MSEDDIFEQTQDAYLALIHPILRDDAYRQEIAVVIALAPSVPDELVGTMITDAGWRERLLGLCLAMSKQPVTFIEPMLQSLRDPRGMAIVPTCAALSVLAQRGTVTMTPSFGQMFNRNAFNGEMGWAADQAMHAAQVCRKDLPEYGPNQGQVFAEHVEVYRWVSQS